MDIILKKEEKKESDEMLAFLENLSKEEKDNFRLFVNGFNLAIKLGNVRAN